jgi:hypothetical protein
MPVSPKVADRRAGGAGGKRDGRSNDERRAALRRNPGCVARLSAHGVPADQEKNTTKQPHRRTDAKSPHHNKISETESVEGQGRDEDQIQFRPRHRGSFRQKPWLQLAILAQGFATPYFYYLKSCTSESRSHLVLHLRSGWGTLPHARLLQTTSRIPAMKLSFFLCLYHGRILKLNLRSVCLKCQAVFL